ncbi:Piso0_005646 [Millerozyma farinosa CBS 7064]|uniref:Piso0_005646 protein n=1 Tax=Pichia sorbitophila (strain ATCC MYA-4447 / BCRC 22081 / CBS 7064 / NBRC 10061 / NRRL Y-12695) TaxID=559304 RepID=G8XZJ8_PICSO|nr:Piso0_005646 [Millerozyma farinosa CBS 7064]
MSGVKRKGESSTTDLRISSYKDDPNFVVGSFFNGVTIPEKTEFDIYKKKKQEEYVVHGENDRLEYTAESLSDSNNDYYVAVYDPLQKCVDLHKAPFMLGRVMAKSRKTFRGPKVKQQGIRNVEQRNALGQEFGTKKAKAAISSLERNRIDTDKLQDIELDIIDNVKETTSDLPSRNELEVKVTDERPTPLANVDATSVEDVYPVYNIIPENEWSYIRVGSIFSEPDQKKRLEILPFGKSFYVSKQLDNVVKTGDTEKLQLLYYASLLFGVYENRRVKDKQSLMLRLQNKPSEILVDGIIDRFTSSRATQFGKSKDKAFVIDPHNEDKLLCYLLATIFHINNFLVELAPLAHELNMKPSRLVGLCRALGATVKPATAGQAEAFGIPKAAASTYKIASLKVPFKLPEMARRGRRNAR